MPRLIIISVCALISLLLVLFSIWPKYQLLSFVQGDVERIDLELQYVEDSLASLQKVNETLRQYETELSKIESALPVDPSIPVIFNFLKKISTENGLSMKDFGAFSITSLSGSSKKDTVQENNLLIKMIFFPLRLSGSYSAFKYFLEVLENNARIFEARNISFSSGEEGIFDFDLQLETYSY